jgi:hypothetical protein
MYVPCLSVVYNDRQRAGLCAGVVLVFRPQPLLIENIKLKLRTKVEKCLSSPNHSLDLQLADVCLSSHTCTKPNLAEVFTGISLKANQSNNQVSIEIFLIAVHAFSNILLVLVHNFYQSKLSLFLFLVIRVLCKQKCPRLNY